MSIWESNEEKKEREVQEAYEQGQADAELFAGTTGYRSVMKHALEGDDVGDSYDAGLENGWDNPKK